MDENDLENHSHAFVIACLMDRQVSARKAWLIPQRLRERLAGDFSFHRLQELSQEELLDFFKNEKESLHRYPAEMSKNLHAAIELIARKYAGVASRIWNERPSSAEVVGRFLEFRGVGPKIATMAGNLLARIFKVPFSDYYSIDISVDRHIRRVFARLGLMSADAKAEEIIYRARALNPRFPGRFDSPCWEIGRTWCGPSQMDCPKCYMQDVCPSALPAESPPERLMDNARLKKLLAKAPPKGSQRSPTGIDDFGDSATVGLHVKRRGKNIRTSNLWQDFGIYLGEHDGLWMVGIKDTDGEICAWEEYPTLGSLKKQWELD